MLNFAHAVTGGKKPAGPFAFDLLKSGRGPDVVIGLKGHRAILIDLHHINIWHSETGVDETNFVWLLMRRADTRPVNMLEVVALTCDIFRIWVHSNI